MAVMMQAMDEGAKGVEWHRATFYIGFHERLMEGGLPSPPLTAGHIVYYPAPWHGSHTAIKFIKR
jgi:hypothetical protein